MPTILFIWMAVSANNLGPKMAWVNAGELMMPEACMAAGRNLGLKPGEEFRCIKKSTGEVVK